MNVHGVVLLLLHYSMGSGQLPTNCYVLEETVVLRFKKEKNIALESFFLFCLFE